MNFYHLFLNKKQLILKLKLYLTAQLGKENYKYFSKICYLFNTCHFFNREERGIMGPID